MNRKVRHSYQILEVEELIVGNCYAFVSRQSIFKSPCIDLYVFDGVIEGDSSDYKRSITTTNAVTIHLDGQTPRSNIIDRGSPTLIFWTERGADWDFLRTYLGKHSAGDASHCIVVPEQRWKDDPKIYVLDWENPDDIIERKIDVKDSGEDWEKRINAKRDAAMAGFFGF